MDISILLTQYCSGLASVGPVEILNAANRILAANRVASASSPSRDFFCPRLVGVTEKHVLTSDGLSIQCDRVMRSVRKTDLVIIPSIGTAEDVEHTLGEHAACIRWIKRMYKGGADLASICTGAYLLAETGLLAGKSATTHWAAAESFARRYPSIQLRSQQILVDEGRICTSAGATSFLSLMIYLIEKFCGRDIAHHVAKILLIDIHKPQQGAYAILSSQKIHADAAVRSAQETIEASISEPLSIESLARSVALSRRNFIRRFKHATGNTPLVYLQRVRMEAAKKQLEYGNNSVADIARSVGYEDVASFRKIFVRIVGLRPLEYRRRYQRANSAVLA